MMVDDKQTVLEDKMNKFVIIITSNSTDPYNVGGIYETEEQAEQALVSEKKTWDERDWYKLEAWIVELKGGK
jgi:hypothetical protein